MKAPQSVLCIGGGLAAMFGHFATVIAGPADVQYPEVGQVFGRNLNTAPLVEEKLIRQVFVQPNVEKGSRVTYTRAPYQERI